jgi:hypothetical protein
MNYPYVSDPNVQRALRNYFPQKPQQEPRKSSNGYKNALKVKGNG